MKKRLKDYFVPHEGNDYTPHGLQKAAILGMSVLVVLSFAIANLQSALWISSDWLVSTVLPAVIVNLTNDERGAALPELRRNSVLDVAATLKAQHMAENEYFSHYSPDGVSPWYWFDTANYNFIHAGENLAIHFTDSGDVVDAWMDSPTHRANILNGNYTEIGVGTAEGTYEGFNTIYVVQLFGTPSAPAALVTPAPVPTPTPAPAPAPAPTPVVAAETTVIEQPIIEEETEVLAEAVEIIETVELVSAEPVPVQPVAVEPAPVVIEDVPLAVADIVPEETDVVDISVTNTSISLYSAHIATTSPGIPASVEPVGSDTNGSPGFLAELATQPDIVLQMLYMLIAVVIVVSLLMSIMIEVRHQEPLQVAYSVGLLALMFGLYQLHTLINNTVLII